MFEVTFYEKPGSEDLSLSRNLLDDAFPETWHTKLDQVDSFFFLADLVNIVNDCTRDLLELPGGEETSFWQVNKAFIAYLNSVYFYREYSKNYSKPVKAVITEYLDRRDLFWLIGETRNHVIHKSIIIKHRLCKAGDIFIALNEMRSKVEENLASLGDSNKRKASAYEYLRTLNALSSPVVLTMEGVHYISVKELVKAANVEISELIQKILKQAFQSDFMPVLRWLLSLIHRENGRYKYTLINRKMPYSPDRVGDDYFDLTYQLETIVAELIYLLGPHNTLCQNAYNWLIEEGYTFDFETEYDIPGLFSEAE